MVIIFIGILPVFLKTLKTLKKKCDFQSFFSFSFYYDIGKYFVYIIHYFCDWNFITIVAKNSMKIWYIG